MSRFKILSQNFCGRTKENHDTPFSTVDFIILHFIL